MLPVPMLFQPASSEEKKKLHKTMSSGDLVKEDSLRKNSQDGRFALQLCISSKKIGKCTQKKSITI